MATELLELQLEELSLVDRPANAEAMVTLFKRDDPNKEDIGKMTDDQNAKVKAYMEKHNCGKAEAMKALGYEVEKSEEADATEELTAEVATLKAENERLRKGLIEEGYVISAEAIQKKAEVEYVEYEGEQINKADIPAPILKALETAAVEKADVELTKRAKEELPHFAEEAAKGLISAVSKMDEVDMLMEALAAADKAFADKMEEFGKSDVDGEFASASDKLENMVKAHMETENLTKKDYAKAYAAVAKTDEGKSLIAQVYKGD